MHDAPTKSGSKLLPDNAYTALKPGEEYQPIVAASDKRAEITPWSVSLGLIMVVVFTAAAAYISLRAGSGIEAAIPIALLAIFFGRMRQGTTILENVMVQSIGQASGVVAAGATFVIPALYINNLSVAWWHILVACALGGTLGVVLIIPLRKYFVKDLHGELPFPEATAINEILVTGESAGASQGKILLIAFFLGVLFDFCIETFHLWNPMLNTTTLLGPAGKSMAGIGMEIKLNAIAAMFGLGIIIGLRYASIIASGSVLAVLVLVPLVVLVGKQVDGFQYAGKVHNIGQMSPSAVFDEFVRPIGIGAIAISGLIGIIRMGKIVVSSVSLGFKGLSKKGRGAAQAERTQLDMAPKNVLLIQLLSTLALGVLFFIVSISSYGAAASLKFAVVGMVVGFMLSFLFTPVAAQAIAIVGVNPVSGMTTITVVLAIGAMILVGIGGPAGLAISLIIGTAVCTALSTSGALITDFKIGYWIGSTPRNQERWKFLGIVVASLIVAFVIPLMHSAYNFHNTDVLPAPQANMIAAVSEGLTRNPESQPWLLYGLGAIVAVVLYMAGVPMLAFALGIYLPIHINAAVLAGAFVGWLIAKTGGRDPVRKARAEQGPLIASGMLAGAAVAGIITAILRQPALGAPIQYVSLGEKFSVVTKKGQPVLQTAAEGWYKGFWGNFIGFLLLLGLAFTCYLIARTGARWLLAERKDEGPSSGPDGDDGGKAEEKPAEEKPKAEVKPEIEKKAEAEPKSESDEKPAEDKAD